MRCRMRLEHGIVYRQHCVAELRRTLGDDKVVLGLSGGVDSTVAAVLLARAIGDGSTAFL